MSTPMKSLADSTIAFVGCGNMGRALLAGLVEGAVPPEQVRVSTRRPERAVALAERYGVVAAATNAACVEGADVVLLAVKPQILPQVATQIAASVHPDALILSVAAGVTTGSIERALGGSPRVVRSMPNTPAVIKQSATAIAPGTHAHDEDLKLADAFFSAIGRVVTVEELHLDAVTGLSGSGPAYVFLMIEAFADAGVKVGLSREIATDLAVQTIKGAAAMLQQTGEHPGRLKDQVTSPGGTAIAGLHTLEEGGLRTTIMNAVEAATHRARQLGSEN